MIKFAKSKLVNNYSWRLAQIGSKYLGSFIILMISGNYLTKQEFGIYNYVLAIIYFISILGDFGVSLSVSKFAAEKAKTKISEITNTISSINFTVLTISLALCATIYVANLYISFTPMIYLLLGMPLILLIPLNSIFDGLLIGREQFKFLATRNLLVTVLTIIMSIPLIIKFGIIGAFIAQTLYSGLLFVAYLIKLPLPISQKFNKTAIDILKYALIIGFANIGFFLFTRLDIILLGHYGYIEFIGYYEVLDKLFRFIILPFSILGTVLAPINIKDTIAKKYTKVQNRLKISTGVLFAIGLVIMILTNLLLPIILKIIFPLYADSTMDTLLTVFIWILPLTIVEATIAKGFLTPLGYAKILTVHILVGGIANLVLDIVLLQQFGYMGVVYATLIIHNMINIGKISAAYFWINKNNSANN